MIEHREHASDRVAVAAEALSVLGTVVLIAWLPFLTRDGRWPITVLVAAAVLLGSAGVLVDLLSRHDARPGVDGNAAQVADAPRDGPTEDRAEPTATVTSVVVLGDEPIELQRHSVALAHRSGPCVVIGTVEHPAATAGLDVTVVTRPTATDALDVALAGIDTDAVLLVSGRAVPLVDDARAVAGHLDDAHPWAVGRTRPFNQDRDANDSGGRIGAGLRRRATTAGLASWEPNATIVRTEDLRRLGLPHRRPRGAWLRARAHEGGTAVVTDTVLTLVAAPASARTFWPDSFAQQRGAAADAAAAVRTEHGRARLLALLLVARESFAWALPTWLLVLFTGTVTGELPFRTVDGTVPALLGGVLLLRAYGLHRSLGVPLRLSADLRSTVDRIPGSIAALPSLLAARIRPTPRRVSVRPLLWAAVLGVAVLATSLVDHPPDARMTMPAVLAALLTLVLLWAVCIQVLAQRGWDRTTFRVDMSLPVRIGGRRGRLLDGSPGGLAVALDDGPDPGVPVDDDHPTVEVDLDDRSTISLPTTVAWSTRTHGRQVLGLTLGDGDDDAMTAWAAQLLRSAGHADVGRGARSGRGGLDASTATRRSGRHDPSDTRGPRDRADRSPRRLRGADTRPLAQRIGDVVGIGIAVVLSVALLAVLGAAMLGLQFAVVRSASMTPTIAQGSVVVSESVPVGDLRAGDVVTRPGTHEHGPVTHRLVSSERTGDAATIVTRGDANESTETWSVPARSTLQRVRWVVPSLGGVVAAARSNVVVVIGVVLVLGLVVAAVRLPTRPRPGTDLIPSST